MSPASGWGTRPSFAATGRHFLSVQPVSDVSWYPWSANSGASRGQPYAWRDPGAGVTQWRRGDSQGSDPNADLAFALYGTVTGPGQISSLSATSLPLSGYLEIFGSNLGGSGQVLIDGLVAPVASWEASRTDLGFQTISSAADRQSCLGDAKVLA